MFRTAKHSNRKRKRNGTPGIVYVLACTGPNDKYRGLYKVGQSRYSASLRATQLIQTRGYEKFGPYRIVCEIPTHDIDLSESLAHKALRHRRVRLRYYRIRELFRGTDEEIILATRGAVLSAMARFRTRDRAYWPSQQRKLGQAMLLIILALLLACLLLG